MGRGPHRCVRDVAGRPAGEDSDAGAGAVYRGADLGAALNWATPGRHASGTWRVVASCTEGLRVEF